MRVAKEKFFYGWIIVIASFVITSVIYGVRYSYGVFFKSMETEFSLSRAETSGVFSAYMVFCAGFAILGGWAIDRYGPKRIAFLMGLFTGLSLLTTGLTNSVWQLFITYSLLLAAGTGAGYAALMSTVSRWFSKKRAVALGIVGSGAGVGTVIVNPLSAYLISSFNWRLAFIVIGLISGIVFTALSLLLKKDPGEMGLSPDGIKVGSEAEIGSRHEIQQPSFSLPQASRTRSFWLFAAIWLLWAFCLHLVFTHFVPHLTDVGVSATQAALLLGLIGGINAVGRLAVGWLSDKINRKITSVVSALLQAGAMFWLMWTRDLWGFYLFVVVFSLGYGGLDPPTLALMGDIFGLRSLGAIMGALIVPWAIGAAIGPAVAGLIFDTSHSYFWAFLTGAVAMLLTALLVVFLKKEKIREI